MKTSIELNDLMVKKVTKTLRGFSLAYLSYLRTAKPAGHSNFAETLRLYVNLYNEMFGDTYDAEQLLTAAKVECNETIDAEHKQESFDLT